MRIRNIFIGAGFALTTLASCVSEISNTPTESGSMMLNVNVKQPEKSRAAEDVKDFNVTIVDETGTVVKSYDNYEDVPASIILAVGNYSVEAHTAGNLERRMLTPYYLGVQDVEIMKDIASHADVVCRMANSKIKVAYDDKFKATFSEWLIVFNDGTDNVQTFTHNDVATDNDFIYWYFSEPTSSIQVDFRGKTTEGSTITQSYSLTKESAEQSYDSDETNFTGGDIVEVKFTPVEGITGKIEGITIEADIAFTETEEDVIIRVEDAEKDDPTPPGPTPGPDGGDIELTLPADLTFDAMNLPAEDAGDVSILAKEGMTSLMVKVVSDSEDMMTSLEAVAEGYPGVDLVNGCEVVENNNLVGFLGSMGQEITVPAANTTEEYKFPIGKFFMFLAILPGEHNFHLTVTDAKGNTKSGIVKITILGDE